MSIIPNVPLPNETRPTDPAAAPVETIQHRLYSDHQRLPDHEAQRQLLERLRYKRFYAGRTTAALSRIRAGVVSGRGIWYWAFFLTMLSAYLSRGLHGRWVL